MVSLGVPELPPAKPVTFAMMDFLARTDAGLYPSKHTDPNRMTSASNG
jgi:hypothetical protein